MPRVGKSGFPRGEWKALPPAVERHMPPMPRKPSFGASVAMILCVTIPFTLLWVYMGWPMSWPWYIGRNFVVFALGLLFIRWRFKRWLKRLQPERTADIMVRRWAKAQRDAAPWN